MGPDCSKRVCPFTAAWADNKDGSVTGREEHYFLECGGKGTCDRKTGTCECFEGFEGKGCRRMSCPGEPMCSGHGTCETLEEVNSGTSWESAKIQICDCDPGWSGYACDERICQPGDDPMVTYSNGALQVSEVQEISIQGDGQDPSGEFTLSYTDWRGATWTTWPITMATSSALSVISIKEALEGLPNHAIPECTVTAALAANDHTITVKFTHAQNSGTQPKLVVNHAGCNLSGCQPNFNGLSNVDAVVVTRSTSGTTENVACSNRGYCDTETGLCDCLDGYYGQACESQTVIL
jgi:hypothetical protein